MTTDPAAYIADCAETGQPVNLAHVAALTGLHGPALQRYVNGVQAGLPRQTDCRRRKPQARPNDGYLALAAAIIEAEAEEQRRQRIGAGVKRARAVAREAEAEERRRRGAERSAAA